MENWKLQDNKIMQLDKEEEKFLRWSHNSTSQVELKVNPHIEVLQGSVYQTRGIV